mgnify:CR=1 FL=1
MRAQQTFEQLLVTHCAPTLAGLKMASLFNYEHGGREQLLEVLRFWKEQMGEYGLQLDILRETPKKALIYVYWEQELEALLQKGQVRRILRDCGYEPLQPRLVLGQLKERMAGSGCFPHEIGLFLGYPLADVIGFIENQGKNCCMCGYWKVYCDEYQARKTFEQYTSCRLLYQRMFQEGVPVVQLIGAKA